MDETESVRRIYCRRYSGCLEVAVTKGWEGFTCVGCCAYDPLDVEDAKRDTEAIITGLIRASASLRSEPGEPPADFLGEPF